MADILAFLVAVTVLYGLLCLAGVIVDTMDWMLHHD